MFRRILRKKQTSRRHVEKVKSTYVAVAGTLGRTPQSPEDSYGDLLKDVQVTQVLGDGKQFVDMVPKGKKIKKQYEVQRQQAGFSLKDFVDTNFEARPIRDKKSGSLPATAATAREHIRQLWPYLERTNRKQHGSLLALPYTYVVPGGRFDEQFYWDSYFIMLGLTADDKWDILLGMVRNHAYMLRKYGRIPTASRSYFLSRSQPPFFAQMVTLLAGHRGRTRTYAEFLPYLLIEYRFWAHGRREAMKQSTPTLYNRLVRMPNGALLGRYFDDRRTPRPEMSREDRQTAQNISDENAKEQLYLNLRAGAESGWDFSSRWFRVADEIQSIQTTNMAAVDLNSMLYTLESTIAEAYTLIKQPLLATSFRKAAERRAETIRRYCWDESERFFCDYDASTHNSSGRVTLAGLFPLYTKIATKEQAAFVAKRIETDFLKPGGLVTTLVTSGQQWDAPNGWAPLQWVAIHGLREYGYHELANEIRRRWLLANDLVYAKHQKMIEKYDVVHPGELGGGGEYEVQDGFGWTNGVYAALDDEGEKQ